MAKRELIDKSEVMMLVDDIFECQCDEKEAYELLNNVSTITEQDIVKPYLEAIEAEAIKYSGTGEGEIQAYDEGLLKAIEIIKKLLSEQEVKEW